MKVGLNGTVLEADEAVISVYDHGFLYGLGLFETFRTYGGRPYLLSAHMERLHNGCRELGIHFSMPEDAVESWVRELLQENGLEDGYVRLTVSAGEAELGLPAADYTEPTVLLLVKPLPPVSEEAVLRGRALRLLNTRRNTPEGNVRFKSLHYMNNILARRELMSCGDAVAPGTEGLMLSGDNWLAEGIVSNLFFYRDGTVYTPDIATGILPGVTRKRVMELAELEGLPVQEGFYTWEQLWGAEEIWITNSIQEVVPVTTLIAADGEHIAVSGGIAGEVTRRILAAYRNDIMCT
ncbi:aminodeoxychorismate lyase [Paenibacillus sp. J5C_2022]|nr:aminodeoxychorismate lyase [Paenibacillus sp. J5C2022]MCU6710781.1 aminodeoxychorismate lyase [Paenibacillus sp. J5C2022]